MPYALIDPKDGQRPGYRLVGEGEALLGEIVVEHEPEGVWDAARGVMRAPTDAERLADLKAARRAEMEAAFSAECGASFSSVWAGLGVMASSPQDARVTALKTRAAKLQTKLAAVEGAATLEAAGAVSW